MNLEVTHMRSMDTDGYRYHNKGFFSKHHVPKVNK